MSAYPARLSFKLPRSLVISIPPRQAWATYGLAQRSALSNSNLVTILNTECWRYVRGKVLVSLLVTGVFWDKMEVLPANDESSVHLGGNDGTS
jgi:hypothetical protein